MAALEKIVKGMRYRVAADKTKHIWNRISFWTHPDDVEFDNGETLTDRMKKVYTALGIPWED